MYSKDRFNNPVYSKTWGILMPIISKLKVIGYKNKNPLKPYLFSKQDNDLNYYMDMGGTEVVKIWEEPCPAFYVFEKERKLPEWKINRLRLSEMELFNKNNIPFRLHFEDNFDDHVDSAEFGINELIPITHDEIDGFCKGCGKDLQSNELSCSDKCETIFINNKLKELEKEELKIKIAEKDDLEKRRLEKEKTGNPLIFSQNKQQIITGQQKQKYYKLFCSLKMNTKSKIRYLREKLIKEGFIGQRKFCEIEDCLNSNTQIHEKKYTFDDLFNQDNYLSLCVKCHANLHYKKK